MKRTLPIFSLLFSLSILSAQVTLNQVDDFEDSTEQGWFEAGASGAPAENVSTDGPNGADDSYLRDYTTQNTTGAGSRLIIRNTTQWTGNFISEGVGSIIVDVRALNVDITIRASITGPGGNFSSPGFIVTAGSGWTQVTLPITSSDLLSAPAANDNSAAGTDVNATLAGVTELRLLSNANPSWIGEVTDAEMHLDNITASAPLSISDFQLQNTEFTISPNPAKDKLNIVLSSNDEMKLEVFDVLGKRVYHASISQLSSSIDVTNWRSGVYLVKVSSDQGTQTKRFIKQ
ncbi:T9SS type A sorting domain-containing protein [Winogradskyella sp.]|uniref:T9SS type A sorting domain-containing protein n=1 Tax=Winogradskyella sp. TaxID=1883156 RepID=UPI0026233AC3|nr:T9SS type A sorting domain-containing protein [Winogradskyella sp.]